MKDRNFSKTSNKVVISSVWVGKVCLPPLLFFLLTLWLWVALDAKEIEHAHISLRKSLDYVESNTQEHFNSRILSLVNMAERWEVRGGTPHNEWRLDAANFIKRKPGLKEVQWINNNYLITLKEPPDLKKSLAVQVAAEEIEEAKKAAANHKMMVSPPLQMPGDKDMRVYIPVYIKTKFTGLMAGVFDIRKIMHDIVTDQFEKDAWLEITYKGAIIFQSPELKDSDKRSWSAGDTITLYDSEWKFRAWPKPEFLSAQRSLLPELALAAGVGLSLLLGFILWQMQVMQRQARQMQEMERMKSEFFSVVSHELRTPVTSIRGALGLIAAEMPEDMPERLKRMVTIADKNSGRLLVLINDILDLDKLAAGKMQFDMRYHLIDSLIYEAVDMNHPYGEKYNVHFKILPVGGQIHIYTDGYRMVQILSNLLSNAAKFSQEKSTIIITANRNGKYIRISVKDQGVGIAKELHPRIFSKFWQADSSISRKKGGTGFGLHISKEMVENLGGHIGFESEAGKGSVFWIELPETKGVVNE